jgi:hypothetical protein
VAPSQCRTGQQEAASGRGKESHEQCEETGSAQANAGCHIECQAGRGGSLNVAAAIFLVAPELAVGSLLDP